MILEIKPCGLGSRIRDTEAESYKGPFKYYVIKKVGGYVRPNAYVCLHSGWVGVARCLRNQKINEKNIF